MPYSLKDKFTLINIMEYLNIGDLGRAIAAYKFFDLSNSFNAAEYSFDEARKQIDIHRKFYFLKEAIVGFNSCYDYALQVIYFAFDFFDKVLSADDYKKLIGKECKLNNWAIVEDGSKQYVKTRFAEDIEALKLSDDNARSFFKEFDKYSNFVSSSDYGIRQWANNIKHQGGFVSLGIVENDKVAYVQCYKEHGVVFTTEWLYPYMPSEDDIIIRLNKQKDNLVNFMDWLFSSIFGNTHIVDFEIKKKAFSANRCIQHIGGSTVMPIAPPENKS